MNCNAMTTLVRPQLLQTSSKELWACCWGVAVVKWVHHILEQVQHSHAAGTHHLQMNLRDALADSLLGQAQTLSDTGKQDEAEQVGRYHLCRMHTPVTSCTACILWVCTGTFVAVQTFL
jgi:hypothetical protein